MHHILLLCDIMHQFEYTFMQNILPTDHVILMSIITEKFQWPVAHFINLD